MFNASSRVTPVPSHFGQVSAVNTGQKKYHKGESNLVKDSWLTQEVHYTLSSGTPPFRGGDTKFGPGKMFT